MTSQSRIVSIMSMSLICLVLAGCVSTDLVQTMMKDIDRLKAQNASLRQDLNALSLEVQALKGGSEEKDEDGDVEAVNEGISEDQPDRDSVIDDESVKDPASSPARLNAEEVYSTAQGLYAQSRYREAYQAFNQASFLDQDEEFLGRCHYWMGECMFAQGAYQQALNHFGAVFGKYSGSSKVSDALLKIGFTYYEMNNYNGARQALNEFLSRYPDHRAASLAEERLNRMTYKESGKAERDH
ncbi:MAG: tetratricopeptide repeat protein [bacterium]